MASEYAMHILAEQSDEVTRIDVCTVTAQAVVALLDDAPVYPAWEQAIVRWESGPFRKLFRRVKPSKWDSLTGLDGVTVSSHNGATVRALVPMPVDETPPPVRRTQLTGWELPVVTEDMPNTTSFPYDLTVQVFLSVEPRLTLGKAAAAAGHAAQLAYRTMPDGQRAAWREAGFLLQIVELSEPSDFDNVLRGAEVVVTDAGYTEVEPGTVTACARW